MSIFKKKRDLDVDILDDCEYEELEFDEELYQQNIRDHEFADEDGEGVGNI